MIISRDTARDLYRLGLFALPFRQRQTVDYFRRLRRVPDLKNPVRHSEKLLARMFDDQNPILRELMTKTRMKELARRAVGNGSGLSFAETYWSGPIDDVRSIEALEQMRVRESWVLKPLNLGGGLVAFGKSGMSMTDRISLVNRAVKSNRKHAKIYAKTGPIAWRGSDGGFILEQRIDADGIERLRDYKVHVFNGTPRLFSVYKNRSSRMVVQHFDSEMKYLFGRNDQAQDLRPPAEIAETLQSMARKMHFGLDYARVDFYWHSDRPWFGEVSPFGALDGLRRNSDLDEVIGRWW